MIITTTNLPNQHQKNTKNKNKAIKNSVITQNEKLA